MDSGLIRGLGTGSGCAVGRSARRRTDSAASGSGVTGIPDRGAVASSSSPVQLGPWPRRVRRQRPGLCNNPPSAPASPDPLPSTCTPAPSRHALVRIGRTTLVSASRFVAQRAVGPGRPPRGAARRRVASGPCLLGMPCCRHGTPWHASHRRVPSPAGDGSPGPACPVSGPGSAGPERSGNPAGALA